MYVYNTWNTHIPKLKLILLSTDGVGVAVNILVDVLCRK